MAASCQAAGPSYTTTGDVNDTMVDVTHGAIPATEFTAIGLPSPRGLCPADLVCIHSLIARIQRGLRCSARCNALRRCRIRATAGPASASSCEALRRHILLTPAVTTAAPQHSTGACSANWLQCDKVPESLSAEIQDLSRVVRMDEVVLHHSVRCSRKASPECSSRWQFGQSTRAFERVLLPPDRRGRT